ncbi:hypothetical protein RhiirA5_384511 [Rhizophagus irregularis]|uniref:RNase H type-1 domain-containing protein n=1 Tax=Rhizophagus irregularis TaxID=588596 RepID=A0A2N0NSU0_9GLOM|nr:hypothetical protein RhiirA5_384511 [Rhizophagus irregularis]
MFHQSQNSFFRNIRKPKWVTAWVPNITDIVYGKILSITHYPNYSTPVSYPEHWKYQNVSSNPQPRTPCSQTITIVPCQAYNDHLIQHGHIPSMNFTPSAPPSLDTRIPPNHKLVSQLVDNDNVVKDLQNLSNVLAPFIELEIYTDGAYDCEFAQNEFPMGYGWTTANLTNTNIAYNGSLEYFPSSTKAKTMAILTALIVCPPNGVINIYTDSQAAIDSVFLQI